MFDPVVMMLGIIALEILVLIYNTRWNNRCLESLIFNMFIDDISGECDTLFSEGNEDENFARDGKRNNE